MFHNSSIFFAAGNFPLIPTTAIGILSALDQEGISRDVLKTNGAILVKGEENKIHDICRALEECGIDKSVVNENGLLLVTSGKNIRALHDIFKRYNMLSIIDKNPSVLTSIAKNKEDLLKLYIDNGLRDILMENPHRLYTSSYEFTLARINFLKSQGVSLSVAKKDGTRKFNPDLFSTSANFQKKYGISGRDLKIKYGRTYKAPKKDLKDLQENTKEVKMSEVEEEGANILRKRAKGKGGQSL